MRQITILFVFLMIIWCSFSTNQCEFSQDKLACQAQLKNGIQKLDDGSNEQLIQDLNSGSVIQANTFNLFAELKQKKLMITLKDNVNWVIYSKIYSQNDIGKQINKKVELIDIYSAFQKTKDSENRKQRHKEQSLNFLLKYRFGDILDFGHGSSFKIEKGGNIVVYTDTWIRASQNKLKVQSILKLDKLKAMTDYQKFQAKSEIQKRQIFQALSSEIQGLKNQIIVENTFSTSLKHASIQLQNNSKILQSSDDTPNKIAIVLPQFSKNRNVFQASFKINVMTGLIGLGVCNKNSLSYQILLRNNGISLSNFKTQDNQQQKPFSFKQNELITVQIINSRKMVHYVQGDQKLDLQFNSDFNIEDLGFCVSVEKNGDEVAVQGFSFSRIQG